MQKDEKNKTMAAVAIVVALVIGMGGGYAIGNSMNDNHDDMQTAAVSESSQRVEHHTSLTQCQHSKQHLTALHH